MMEELGRGKLLIFMVDRKERKEREKEEEEEGEGGVGRRRSLLEMHLQSHPRDCLFWPGTPPNSQSAIVTLQFSELPKLQLEHMKLFRDI